MSVEEDEEVSEAIVAAMVQDLCHEHVLVQMDSDDDVDDQA